MDVDSEDVMVSGIDENMPERRPEHFIEIFLSVVREASGLCLSENRKP